MPPYVIFVQFSFCTLAQEVICHSSCKHKLQNRRQGPGFELSIAALYNIDLTTTILLKHFWSNLVVVFLPHSFYTF